MLFRSCVNLCDAVYSDVVLFIMAAMSGIICTYIVSDVLVQVQWISKFMSYIGRNTLVIFGTHSLAISLVVYIMNNTLTVVPYALMHFSNI